MERITLKCDNTLPEMLFRRGSHTVENHVRYLEIHLVEKLKEKIYVSFEDLNAEIKKIVAVLNKRSFQGKDFSRQDAFEKYDKGGR